MKKLSPLIICLLLAFVMYNCKHTSEKVESTIISKLPFVLSQNERKLLLSDSCSKKINIDTLKSISNFRNSLKQFYLKKKKGIDEIQISFDFITNDSLPIERLKFQYKVLYPFTSGGGFSLTNYYYLFVEVTDNNKIDIVAPNGLYNQDIKKLNEYITLIYKKPLDSTNFLNVKDVKKRLIRISFKNENVKMINQTLSQLIMGYIIAQRELCKEYFKKDINEVSINELIKLRTRTPLVFKLTTIKEHYPLNPQPPTTN